MPLMLAIQYGYKPPSANEIMRAAVRVAKWHRKRSFPPTAGGRALQASLISADPFISYSGLSLTPIGLAGYLAGRVPRLHRGWFLLSPTWSIEDEAQAKWIRTHAVLHRLRHPRHQLIFLCNSSAERDLLHRFGEAAIFLNKTCVTSEEVFRPLADVPVEFDAIYNAQLAPWKRHELALDVPSCAFIFYRDLIGSSSRESEAALIARHTKSAPRHVFINAIEGGEPVRLAPEDVNRHLNRASVGLCLSEVEGAMFASTEYMLVGLPVVSTPNRGGRDTYFNTDSCLTVAAEPRAVAEAVAALKARAIPRAHIRTRVLKQLEHDRRRFIDLINAIHEEAGSATRLSMPWPFRRPVIMRWQKPEDAVAAALAGRADALAPE
jgi:glycosyltransferase involved in cell wall biosynthesis